MYFSKINYLKITKIKIIFFLVFICHHHAFAVESRSKREAITTPRGKKFYKGNRAKQYLSFTGGYSSDKSSTNQTFDSRYLFQSYRFIHEVNFDYKMDQKDVGTGSKKRFNIKTSQAVDFTLANKIRLFSSQFYGVLYHRLLYDELSSYYYDHRTAGGGGYIFFKDKWELDVGVSNYVVKDMPTRVDFIASSRINFKLADNLTLNQRSFLFLDKMSVDYELRTSLIYRLNQKTSFEIRHNFEKRRYRDFKNKPAINDVSRAITVGLVFDLGGMD